mmetsp:Transcript_11538/g.34614  ORF Transcript_11538/g.34614 Transcript_11538/m.34614 type:complete len:788 (-) Transcript_11538:314-2677(-)
MPQFRRKTKRTHKAGAKGKAKEESDSSAEETGGAAAAALEAKEKAAQLKAEGNTAFSAGQWEVALGKFTEAIALDPTDHVFFSNRSAANLQLLRTRDAVSDARECVRLNPTWPKGHSRLGAALFADKQAIAAKAAYEEGLKLEPANAAMLEGLAAAKPAAAEEEKRLEEERKQEAPEGAAQAQTSVAPPEETTVIGIDLGTTFSCCAIWRHGNVEILEDESGSRTTPSFVAFTEDGGRLVGEAAKMQAAKNTKNTFYDIKRILGQKMVEPKVREEVKRFPFEVVADPATDDPRIVVEALGGKQMPPEQISGLVLAHMKRVAEAKLGHPVKKAVVTVPAYFNDAQRTATKAAGAIAGLDVLRIINEPTAAALAYGLDKNDTGAAGGGCKVLIYDLGGGTFDVSVLQIEEGMFTVKATGGDTHLGGEDFDNVVVEHFFSELKQKHGVDAKGDAKLGRKLRTAVEKAKRALSSGTTAQLEVEDYCLELSRAKFEALNKAPFDRTLDTVKKVLKDAKLTAPEIDDVVLVGGSTRVPRIQEMLSQFFGGRQLCRSINPDEAVAYGAAVQGAILSGVRHAATDALLLVDVTPLSLGIETEGKNFSVLIPRNTSIPCKKADTYTTTEDYQESIEICVYEGERPCIDGNRKLGEFSIKNIERAKRGEPQLEVTFELDANGILNVTARDKKTQACADCRIEGACKGMDPAEISRMVKEAETFASEDAEYRRQMELKTDLESLAFDLRDQSERSEGVDKGAGQKAQECLDWLESLGSLGKPAVGRALERWLKDLRAC